MQGIPFFHSNLAPPKGLAFDACYPLATLTSILCFRFGAMLALWLGCTSLLAAQSTEATPTKLANSQTGTGTTPGDSSLVHWAWNREAVAAAGDQFWPEFRGPESDGRRLASLPVTEWSESSHVLWKTPIHGQGWSSPVVWGDRIWLTTATPDGKRLSVIALQTSTGKIVVDRVLFDDVEVQKDHHVTNSYASPTPVCDGENVYVHFGAYGTAALDAKTGETRWMRQDLPCNHFRGPGSSPILFKNLLIFHMDGFDFKYVVALDKTTGNTVWKTDRQIDYGTSDGDVHKAYSTPLLIETEWGLQMICVSSKATIAYRPQSGEEIWRVRYDEYSTTARPIFDGQHVFINSGFSKAHLLAVRPAPSGDITDTHVTWNVSRSIGCKPSHVWVDNWIFSLEDRGVLTCLDKQTGEQVWQERLGGDFSASPIVAGKFLFVFDHDGKGYVYLADGSGTRVAINQLETGCRASPAVLGNQLLIRTTEALYLLGESP